MEDLSELTERINEVKIENHPINEINEIDYDLLKVCNSVCKIIINAKNGKRYGSGFLIKLNKGINPLFCLMTNEHVITRKDIESKENIEIYYKNHEKNIIIKLDKNERFIKDYKDM